MTTSSDEVKRLQERDHILSMLEAGGVDNWDGYDLSLEEWRKEKDDKDRLYAEYEKIEELLGEGVDEPAGSGCGYGFLPTASDDAFAKFLEIIKKENENDGYEESTSMAQHGR